jgi:hypothetical protein
MVRDRADSSPEEAAEGSGPKGHTESAAGSGQLLEDVSTSHTMNFRSCAAPVRQVHFWQLNNQLPVRG